MSEDLTTADIVPFAQQVGGTPSDRLPPIGAVSTTESGATARHTKNRFFKLGSHLLKTCTREEFVFYEGLRDEEPPEVEDAPLDSNGLPPVIFAACPAGLAPIVPEYFGTRKVDGLEYLVMSDLTDGMVRPSIFDVKLGTVTTDPYAPPEKVASESAKFPPAAQLGFRVTGMRLWTDESHQERFQKEWSRALLTEDALLTKFACAFVSGMSELQKRVLVGKLKTMADLWEMHGRPNILVFATSLFVSYDADHSSESETEEEDTAKVQVKLIDFGHVFYKKHHPTVENGVLIGIKSILRLFAQACGIEV